MGPEEITAHIVGVTPAGQYMPGGHYFVEALPSFLLPSASKTTLAFTTQLNACTFCYLPLPDGGLVCGHLRPPRQIEARELQRLLRDARFLGYEDQPFRRYGPCEYYPNGAHANVVGVFHEGRWRLYAQEFFDTHQRILGYSEIDTDL